MRPRRAAKSRALNKTGLISPLATQDELNARTRACTPGRTVRTSQENLRSARGHSLRPGSRLSSSERARTARYRRVNEPRHTQVTYKASKHREQQKSKRRAEESNADAPDDRGQYRVTETGTAHRHPSRHPRPRPGLGERTSTESPIPPPLQCLAVAPARPTPCRWQLRHHLTHR